MTLFAFLLRAVGPLAIKILAALGVSVMTFTGVDLAVTAMLDHVTSAWSGLPADAAAMLGLAGIGQLLGMVTASITARVAMWSAASASKWVVAG